MREEYKLRLTILTLAYIIKYMNELLKWKIYRKIRQFKYVFICLFLCFLLNFDILIFFKNVANKEVKVFSLLESIFHTDNIIPIITSLTAMLISVLTFFYDKKRDSFELDIQKLNYLEKHYEQDEQNFLDHYMVVLKRIYIFTKDNTTFILFRVERIVRRTQIALLKQPNTVSDIDDSVLENEDLLFDTIETELEKDAKTEISKIKNKIAEEKNIPIKHIKYSKNYYEAAQNSNFKWTTWYALRESYIDDLNDKDTLVFVVKINEEYKAASISGKELKDLNSKMKSRNTKNGDPQFDLYLSKNKDGSFYENRNKFDLPAFKDFDISFIKVDSKGE